MYNVYRFVLVLAILGLAFSLILINDGVKVNNAWEDYIDCSMNKEGYFVVKEHCGDTLDKELENLTLNHLYQTLENKILPENLK